MSLTASLARALCAEWSAISEDGQTWETRDGEWRADFVAMAQAGLDTARANRGLAEADLELRMAAAMNRAWLAPRSPYHQRRFRWEGGLLPAEREVFVRLARALVAAGRDLRSAA